MKPEDLLRIDDEPTWFDKEQWVLGVLCLEDGDAHPTLHVRTVDECHRHQDREFVTARFIFIAARDCELLAVWTERPPQQPQFVSGPPPSFGGEYRQDQPTASNRAQAGDRLFVDRTIYKGQCQ